MGLYVFPQGAIPNSSDEQKTVKKSEEIKILQVSLLLGFFSHQKT